MTHEERKAKNPDYQVCMLEDSPFKGVAKSIPEFFQLLAADIVGCNPKKFSNSHFADTELTTLNKAEKKMNVDLLLAVSDNYYINFEANTYKSEMINLKNTFYTYKLILIHQAIGKTYKDIKVDQINLDLLPTKFNKNVINTFIMIDPKTHERLPGTPRIIHISLDKFKKNPYNVDVSDWRRRVFGLFLSTSIKESKELAGDDPILRKVADFMEEYSNNIENLRLLDQQSELMKALRTDAKIASEKAEKAGERKGKKIGLKQGLQQGIEQGLHQGEEKKALDMAKKLKNNGVDVTVIANASGLSVEKIEAL